MDPYENQGSHTIQAEQLLRLPLWKVVEELFEKLLGRKYQIPKLYNRSETAATPGEYSNNELTTWGVLRLRPAENVTDTTWGRKPSGAGWNKNLLLWCTFGFSDRMIIKGKVCAICLKNFNGYDEIEIQNSRILQDIGV